MSLGFFLLQHVTWKSLLPKEMAVGEEMVAEGIVSSSILFSRDIDPFPAQGSWSYVEC